MELRNVQVKIKGLSPLLMHRFPMEDIEAIEKKTAEEQAEIAAYRHPESKELYIPGENLWSCLVAGAVYVKGKGRASLQKVAAASLSVNPSYLMLGKKKYAVDSRKVRIPSTRGSVVRYRPRIEDWETEFTLTYDATLMSEKQAREIVDNAGARVGLLDFRPATKGPFGRFNVVQWKNE